MRNAHRWIAGSLAIVLIAGVANWRRARVPEPEWEPVLWLGSGLEAFPPNVKLSPPIAINRKGIGIAPWAFCEAPDGFAYIDHAEGMLHVCQRGRRSYVSLASIGRHAEEVTDLLPAPDGLFLAAKGRIYHLDLKRREWKALDPDIVWAKEEVLVTRSGRVLTFGDRHEIARLPGDVARRANGYGVDDRGTLVARFAYHALVWKGGQWNRIDVPAGAAFDGLNSCFWRYDGGFAGMFGTTECQTIDGQWVNLAVRNQDYPGFYMKGETVSVRRALKWQPTSEKPVRISIRKG